MLRLHDEVKYFIHSGPTKESAVPCRGSKRPTLPGLPGISNANTIVALHAPSKAPSESLNLHDEKLMHVGRSEVEVHQTMPPTERTSTPPC